MSYIISLCVNELCYKLLSFVGTGFCVLSFVFWVLCTGLVLSFVSTEFCVLSFVFWVLCTEFCVLSFVYWVLSELGFVY